MSEDSKAKDLAGVWKNQPEEKRPVNLDGLVDRRARELHAATRAEIVMSIGAALFFVAVMAWRFASDQGRVPQFGLVTVIAWVLITLYWFRGRIRRADAPPKDALAVTGQEHYRKELERRRDHLRNAWLWHGPLLLACMILIAVLTGKEYVAFRGLERVLPLVVALAVWTGFGLIRRRRQANELQREIGEIDKV
jgi:hypothetical protein